MAGSLTLRLPRKPQPLTLGDLKEEIRAATAVPYEAMQVFASGGLMTDDRQPLTHYRLRDGDAVTLVGQPLRRPVPPRGAAGKGARRKGGGGGGGKHAPGASPPAREATAARPTPEFEAQQAAAARRKAAEADTSEEGVARRIAGAQAAAEVELLPEMEQLERSVAAIASHGLDAVRDVADVPAQAISLTGANAREATAGTLNVHQIVLEHKKISELLLRQLLTLDNITAPTDTLRSARKTAVRQVQAGLDRVDAAWIRAKSLGVKPDM